MPEAAVAAVITRRDAEGTKILLTRRSHEPFNGMWCLPGGHIEPYETVVDAIRREVNEETGLDFTPRFFGFFDERIPEREHHHVVCVFEGSGAGEVVLQASEVSEYRWFQLQEARALPMAFRHNDILDAYAGKQLDEIERDGEHHRQAALSEYSALREEILKRMELRQALEIYVLAGAAALYGVAKITALTPFLPLTYPLVAFFLALSWSQHDYRAKQIGDYISRYVEPDESERTERQQCSRWEHHLDSYYSVPHKRSFTAIAAGGVFIFAQLLTMTLGISWWWISKAPAKQHLLPSVIAFLAVDILAVVATCMAVHRRRKEYRKGTDRVSKRKLPG